MGLYLEGWGKLFEAGVKLQDVARGLKKIIACEDLTLSEEKTMSWAGDLLGQIDWNSEHYNKEGSSGIVVLATQLRPSFYLRLHELRIPFDDEYFNRAHLTLKSLGKKGLNAEEIPKFQELFQKMANSISNYLQRDIGKR